MPSPTCVLSSLLSRRRVSSCDTRVLRKVSLLLLLGRRRPLSGARSLSFLSPGRVSNRGESRLLGSSILSRLRGGLCRGFLPIRRRRGRDVSRFHYCRRRPSRIRSLVPTSSTKSLSHSSLLLPLRVWSTSIFPSILLYVLLFWSLCLYIPRCSWWAPIGWHYGCPHFSLRSSILPCYRQLGCRGCGYLCRREGD